MTVGAIEDSRLTGGTLTIGGTSFAKQMTAVTLTPAVREDGEAVETLSGATISADEVTDWTLDLGLIQDFDDPAGFVMYAFENNGTEVDFSWKPNSGAAPTFSGQVKVRAVAVGGEVKARLNQTTSWPVVGQPTPATGP